MFFDGSAPVPLKRRRFTNFDSMEVEEAKVGLFENLPSPQHIKSSRFLVLGRSGFSLLQSICCLNSTGYLLCSSGRCGAASLPAIFGFNLDWFHGNSSFCELFGVTVLQLGFVDSEHVDLLECESNFL